MKMLSTLLREAGQAVFKRKMFLPKKSMGNLARYSTITFFQPDASKMEINSRIKTTNDQELINFLKEEIIAKKEHQKGLLLLTSFDGFYIALNQSEISFTKTIHKDTLSIKVNLNLNHNVDGDFNGEEKETQNIIIDLPKFEIHLKNGVHTLSFGCSYYHCQDEDNPYQLLELSKELGIFKETMTIESISLFDGERNDQVYSIQRGSVDRYLYTFFKKMLEERGITDQLMEKVFNYSVQYEYQLYANTLRNIQKFLN